MDTPASFGQYVTQGRQRHNISAKKLAIQLGVALSTITRIERGSIPEPNLFIALVDALNLNVITAVQLIEPYRCIYERIMTALEVT
jgi:transcriptional regulator with XRE-family HTH domain